MKKVTIILFCFLFGILSANAQEKKMNVVHFDNSIEHLALETVKCITFASILEGGVMIINCDNGVQFEYPLNEIRTITFSPFGMIGFPIYFHHSGIIDTVNLDNVVEITFSDLITDVITHSAMGSFIICYPNPFSENISIKLNGTDIRSIEIYSLQGLIVARLDNISSQSDLQWDGYNLTGQKSVPGVYYVRTLSINHSQTEIIIYKPE